MLGLKGNDLKSSDKQARKPAGPGTATEVVEPTAPSTSSRAGQPPAPRPTTSAASNPGFVPVFSPVAERAPQDRADRVVVRDVLVGEAKSALVTTGRPTTAAVTRMVNSSEKSKLSNPLVQQAPPANPTASRRDTPAAEVGPLLIDTGALSSHARNGCAEGETTRASASLGAVAVAGHGTDALVAAPDRMTSVSSTGLDHSGPEARAVSSASVTAGTFELLDGKIHLKVIKSPRLTTTMSVTGTPEVRYTPAEVELSGKGIRTTTLKAAGDSMEMSFADRTESGTLPALPGPLGNLPVEPPLALPAVPGLPSLGGTPEATPATGPGTTVRVSLGKPRHATEATAVAARATAIEVTIAKRPPSTGAASARTDQRGKPGYGGDAKDASVTLDLAIGVLESASVAARPTGRGVSAGTAGGSGALPVTGPGVAMLAIAGAGLLAAGAVAFTFGRKRRQFRA